MRLIEIICLIIYLYVFTQHTRAPSSFNDENTTRLGHFVQGHSGCLFVRCMVNCVAWCVSLCVWGGEGGTVSECATGCPSNMTTIAVMQYIKLFHLLLLLLRWFVAVLLNVSPKKNKSSVGGWLADR